MYATYFKDGTICKVYSSYKAAHEAAMRALGRGKMLYVKEMPV